VVTDVVKEGQQIPVKLLEIDKMGRLNLSYIDAVDPDGAGDGGGYERPREDRPRGEGRRDDHRGPRRR
jgi:polyribonucleotide nucleotidyltransferase